MELGSCRVHSAMRLTSLSSPSSSSAAAASMHAPKLHSANCLVNMDDSTCDGLLYASRLMCDDADCTWESFPCPFCYVEVEVPVLRTHLQEEHCFDTKNAVCPICAASPGRDMIEHMTVQHSYLLKRRKSQRTNLWTSNPDSFQKERFDSSFLGAATKKQGNSSDSAPDPLLSSFIHNSSFTDSKNHQEVNCDSSTKGPSSLPMQSADPSTSNQVMEQNCEVRNQMANFLQEMLLSTIF